MTTPFSSSQVGLGVDLLALGDDQADHLGIALEAHATHATGGAPHRADTFGLLAAILADNFFVALFKANRFAVGGEQRGPEVMAAPTRRSSSSRSMAIRPTLRGRENWSRLVRLTVPLAVAKKM